MVIPFNANILVPCHGHQHVNYLVVIQEGLTLQEVALVRPGDLQVDVDLGSEGGMGEAVEALVQ